MKISEMIEALNKLQREVGDLDVELLEETKYGCLPKESYMISVCEIDGRKFIDISDVWGSK